MSGKQSKGVRTREIKQTNPVSVTLFFLVLGAGALASAALGQFAPNQFPLWFAYSFLPAFYVLFALKIANQWEKAIVLRFGKFHRVAGPGLFWIIPIIETIPTWVDQRVMVSPFSAQKTLTRDTVPVDVDAVLFWVVWDAQKAALEVENYHVAVDWAAKPRSVTSSAR
jgi:regulator of protease activity HflC (stomatin/prohibitin superfamily)